MSVNVGRAEPTEHSSIGVTGIDKRPVAGPVNVRPPGSQRRGLGSGLVGDAICDHRHHGGDDQAVDASDPVRHVRRLARPLLLERVLAAGALPADRIAAARHKLERAQLTAARRA